MLSYIVSYSASNIFTLTVPAIYKDERIDHKAMDKHLRGIIGNTHYRLV